MKSKTIKIGFALSFLIVQVFGFMPFIASAANTCKYSDTFSADKYTLTSSDRLSFTASLTRTADSTASTQCVNQVYVYLEAQGTNGRGGYLTEDTPVATFRSDGTVSVNFKTLEPGTLAALLPTAPKKNVLTFRTTVNDYNTGNQLTQSGGIDIAYGSGAAVKTCQNDVGCANAGSSSNGYICSQGQCVEDAELPAGSHCVINASLEDCDTSKGLSCNPSSNTCATAQTPTVLYGCVAATTGVFTCATTQTDPGIAACANNGGIINIPSANCGCTQAEVTASVTGKNCRQNGGTGTVATPPAGGQTANSVVALQNPIEKYKNLTDLLVNIMKGFLGIIAVWAVAFIVIGGFKMVISSGNEEAVLSAKKTITWAVLGLLVAVLSFAIVAIVQNLIGVNVPAPISYNIQQENKI